MGAPGYTVFCAKGHIVQSVGHHEMCFDEVKACMCGCDKLGTVVEWGDSDALENDGAGPVPLDPIRFDEVITHRRLTVLTDGGAYVTGRLVQSVPVYDVSELFKE